MWVRPNSSTCNGVLRLRRATSQFESITVGNALAPGLNTFQDQGTENSCCGLLAFHRFSFLVSSHVFVLFKILLLNYIKIYYNILNILKLYESYTWNLCQIGGDPLSICLSELCRWCRTPLAAVRFAENPWRCRVHDIALRRCDRCVAVVQAIRLIKTLPCLLLR